jgi:uncharacterized membrane protein (DUF106 family)
MGNWALIRGRFWGGGRNRQRGLVVDSYKHLLRYCISVLAASISFLVPLIFVKETMIEIIVVSTEPISPLNAALGMLVMSVLISVVITLSVITGWVLLKNDKDE